MIKFLKSLKNKKSLTDFSDTKKKELANQSPMWISEELEWWNDRVENVPKFVNIAALYSELIALSSNGQLYQWRWADPEPFKLAEVRNFVIFDHIYNY